MAQVSRELKKIFLKTLPESKRNELLEKYPNLRKAAPSGSKIVFNKYLNEFSVNIDTHFKVERIMWTGNFEPVLINILPKWVNKDSVCIDIGANVGAITIGMAAHLRNGAGKVYAFEPCISNFKRLEANIQLNPSLQPHVIATKAGLSKEPGTLYWVEEKENPGNGGLTTDPQSGEAVPVTTLDIFCQEHKITHIDVIKVDVEGMEYEVFQGAVESLSRWKPKLYFETLSRFKDAGGDDNFTKIEKLLGGIGYKFFKFNSQNELIPTNSKTFGGYTVAIAE